MFRFSESIQKTPKSFIREILKLTMTPDIISFAGGLPNKKFFPVEEINAATDKVLTKCGQEVLQYSTTEGYEPLREFISERYKKKGLNIPVDEILILNGSQQALDLMGKIFIDDGDNITIEKPGYLGAIQAFSLFSPVFNAVSLEEDGINLEELDKTLAKTKAKFLYVTPNFQNPSGLTYSLEKREKAAEIAIKHDCVLIEDDPYGELRFIGTHKPPIKTFAKDYGVLLGTFSKISAPGLRLGWVCATKEIMDKLIIAKQAADLHSNFFAQRVLSQYLQDKDIDAHIQKIKDAYLEQRTAMVDSMEQLLPKSIKYTQPEGGMFLWCSLPEGMSSLDLFHIAVKHKVAFVPGDPFYTDGRKANTFRLNFSCSNVSDIKEGVKRLSDALKEFLK